MQYEDGERGFSLTKSTARVEIDITRSDIFVVSAVQDHFGGRPYLVNVTDSNIRMLLGIHSQSVIPSNDALVNLIKHDVRSISQSNQV